jgi:hypothetical protein
MQHYWATVNKYKLQYPEMTTEDIRSEMKRGKLDYVKSRIQKKLDAITDEEAINFYMEKAGYSLEEAIKEHKEHPDIARNIIVKLNAPSKPIPMSRWDVDTVMRNTGYTKQQAEEYVKQQTAYAVKQKEEEEEQYQQKKIAKKAAAEQRKKDREQKKLEPKEPKGAKKSRSVAKVSEIPKFIYIPKEKKERVKKVVVQEAKGNKKSRSIQKIKQLYDTIETKIETLPKKTKTAAKKVLANIVAETPKEETFDEMSVRIEKRMKELNDKINGIKKNMVIEKSTYDELKDID